MKINLIYISALYTTFPLFFNELKTSYLLPLDINKTIPIDSKSSTRVNNPYNIDKTLSNIIEYELIPLLKEYWFDESTKVHDWSSTLRGAIK